MPNGGRRPGAGRKSKAEELGLPMLLAECVTDDERKAIIRKLVGKAKRGDLRAIELYLAYQYGKPRQAIEHSGLGGLPLTVRVIYADAAEPDDHPDAAAPAPVARARRKRK